MNPLNLFISIFVPVVVFVVGLQALGYSDVIRLSLHLVILVAISRSIIGLYNILAFRLTLNATSDQLARIYAEKSLPSPKQYGYFVCDPFKMEKWYGQTYLEDIAEDFTIDPVTRLEAKILVSDIHKAEKSNWIQEKRLMRLALEGMTKYHTFLKKIESETERPIEREP